MIMNDEVLAQVYGLLWLDVEPTANVLEAKKLMREALPREIKMKGVEWAANKYASTLNAER